MFMNNREIKNKDIQKIYKTKKNVAIGKLDVYNTKTRRG